MIAIETTIGMLLHVALLVLGEDNNTYKALAYMFDDAFMDAQKTNALHVVFAWDGIVVKWNNLNSSCTYDCEKAQSMAMAVLVVTLSF